MKQRLLVMNGQRILQTEQGGQWKTEKVEKANTVKPGIYHIHLATQADKASNHAGVILHVDRAHVYQQVGKNFVLHDLDAFTKVPEIGANASVKYEDGKAIVSKATIKLSRGIS
jgi:cell filamentation protein